MAVAEEGGGTSFWRLVRSRNFGLLWGSSGLSGIGDQFDLIAFPWLVLAITGDPVAVGLVIAVGNIPPVFFLLVGGALVDRFSPRTVMLASNGARFALVAGLATLVLTGVTDLWVIYVFAAFKGVADSFYYPGQLAILPRIVPSGLLRQSNAVIHTTTELSGFAGPALAGGLIALLSGGGASAAEGDNTGIGLAFAVASLTFLVSSIMLLLMRRSSAEPEAASAEADEPGMLSSIKQGVRYVVMARVTLVVFLLIAGVELLIEGPITVGIPIVADTRLREGALALGVIASAFAGGSVLGAVLAGTLPPPRGALGPTIVTLIALTGVCLMPFGILTSMWVGAALTLVIGTLNGYADVQFTSWLQGRTPQAMLGRVMSLLMVASVALSPISVAASGALIKLSLTWVFVGSGALVALFCIVMAFRREVREIRVTEEAGG